MAYFSVTNKSLWLLHVLFTMIIFTNEQKLLLIIIIHFEIQSPEVQKLNIGYVISFSHLLATTFLRYYCYLLCCRINCEKSRACVNSQTLFQACNQKSIDFWGIQTYFQVSAYKNMSSFQHSILLLSIDYSNDTDSFLALIVHRRDA